MKIGFDISQTGAFKAGCGYVADGLIHALAEMDLRNHYILYPSMGALFWDPDYATSTFRCQKPNFRRWPAPTDFDQSRNFWLNPDTKFEESIGRPDIFHSNNFFCPSGFSNTRLVYTLYDLGFLDEPSWTTEANRIGCFQGVFGASLAADQIVAISEHSRNHFLKTFPHYPPERITIIHPASRFPGRTAPVRPDALSNLAPGGFWLSVGTIEPRKNYRGLLEAYRILRADQQTKLPLVLAGGKGWLMDDFHALVRGLELERDVILPGYVSDAELEWLYRNCFAFVYPSLFEGFGMPVLEALGLGAPVLSANVSSLPEVAGDAAIYFDPAEPRAIAAAMTRIANGEIDRNALRAAGLERAKQFSWTKSAADLLALYDRVMQEPRWGTAPVVEALPQA